MVETELHKYCSFVNIVQDKEFSRRNGYTANNILLLLRKFRKIRVQNSRRNVF